MKALKILVALMLTLWLITSTFAADFTSLDATNNKTIQVVVSDDIELPVESVEAEMRVLKNIDISFAGADVGDAKKVIVDLGEDMQTSTSYNLIGLVGTDATIDFTTWDDLIQEVIAQYETAEWQKIVNVSVKDARTVELTFQEELTQTVFEFKLLKELSVAGISSISNKSFDINLEDTLEVQKDYIVMALSLKDITGVAVTLDEELYDLTTSETMQIIEEAKDEMPEVPEEEVVVDSEETTPDTLNTPDEPQIDTEVLDEEVPELNAAGEEGNVDEVAAQAQATPETGAATNVLIFITFMLTGLLIFRNKFMK